MARLSGLLFVLLTVVAFLSVSADNAIYSVTFVSCVANLTCPQGNLLSFNQTFALNGTISPNLTLNVGDRLEFDLATDVPIHPLTICQNSPVPSFCQDAANSDQLNSPITQAGTNTSVTFTTAGTYYYGCLYHPGMGAIINVVQTTASTSSSSTGSSIGTTPSSLTGSSTGTTPSSSTGSSTGTTSSSSTGSSTGTTPSSLTGSSIGTTPSSSTGSSTGTTPSSSTGSSIGTTLSSANGSSTSTTPSSSSTTQPGTGHRLCAPFLFTAVIPLLVIIFI